MAQKKERRSLFSLIFGNRPKPNIVPTSSFQTFNAYVPVFTTSNGEIYENELIRSAIDARARNIAKLSIHIEGVAHKKSFDKIKVKPNSLMTWYKFIYRVSTILDNENTCYIVPIYDELGDIVGIYPILPSRTELLEYEKQIWIRYTFQNGQKASMEYNKCAVLTKFQYLDDFRGETNRPLRPTLTLSDINNQAIKEGIKSAASYRFMATMNNFQKDEDLKKTRQHFNEQNFKGDGTGGLLLFPNTMTNVTQIQSKPFIIDTPQMNQIKENVFNYYGVNEKIIQSKANDEEMDAFYSSVIEPFAIQISEELSKMFYTDRERNQGNKIIFTSSKYEYMSTKNKVAMAQTLSDRGMMTIDEVRQLLFNLPPLPDGKGNFATIRGEYYNVLDPTAKLGQVDTNDDENVDTVSIAANNTDKPEGEE